MAVSVRDLWRVVLVLACVWLAPEAASGQPAEPSPAARRVFEYWFGPSAVSSGFDGTVATDYPATLDVGTAEGRASQRLTVNAPRHLGVGAGIGLFPARQVGVQFLLDYVTRELTGASSPYAVSLNYIAMLPPDDVPRQVHAGETIAWPAPTGSATQLTLSANGAWRYDAGRRLSVTISGGLTAFRSKGSGESLAYTRFWLGGHSVLSSSALATAFKFGPVTSIGFNLGGNLGINLAGPLDLIVDVRAFRDGDIRPEIELTRFVDRSEPAGELAVDALAERMAPIRASFDPSFARVFLGVRVRP